MTQSIEPNHPTPEMSGQEVQVVHRDGKATLVLPVRCPPCGLCGGLGVIAVPVCWRCHGLTPAAATDFPKERACRGRCAEVLPS